MGHLTKEMFAEILSRCALKPAVYVETGANHGDQLVVAQESGFFSRCLGVELDTRYAAKCRERVPGAHLFVGDSAKVVGGAGGLAESIKEPAFWLLDAHYCALDPPIDKSRFPLWDELRWIRQRSYPDVVVVDDVHTFGKDRPDLRFREGSIEWEEVTKEALDKIMEAKGFELGDGWVMIMSDRRSP